MLGRPTEFPSARRKSSRGVVSLAFDIAGCFDAMKQRVAVIGAGPSGLVACKYCIERGYDVTCFEAADGVGGTFVSKAYENGNLVSSTTITSFSDHRWVRKGAPAGRGGGVNAVREKDLPWHPPVTSYVEYLKSYAKRFGLDKVIKYGARVSSVTKCAKSSMFKVRVEGTGHAETYHIVLNCTGVHHVANRPEIPGADTFPGTLIHSEEYKTPRGMFAGKRVLIIGCGETAMDVAHAAVQGAAAVTMSIRNGFLSVPTMMGDVPLDSMITNLFESTRCHRWLERHHFRWMATTPIIRTIFGVCTGTTMGFNQWGGALHPVKRGYHIINKSGKAMPYINAPLKKQSWWGRRWRWLDGDTGDKEIHLAPIVESVRGDAVTFSDGSVRHFDVIILATGYKPGGLFSSLPPATIHNIVNPQMPNFASIGFVRPNVGAIPPMAEIQIMWYLEWLSRGGSVLRVAQCRSGYRLLGNHPRTDDIAVDYGIYMHKLAEEIGAVPSATDFIFNLPGISISDGIKGLFSYAYGQAYVSFFRLVGPFACKGMSRVVCAELYTAVSHRGWWLNAVFVLTSSLFAVAHAAAYALDGALWLAMAALVLVKNVCFSYNSWSSCK